MACPAVATTSGGGGQFGGDDVGIRAVAGNSLSIQTEKPRSSSIAAMRFAGSALARA